MGANNLITKWIELKSTFEWKKVYLVSKYLWGTLKNSHPNKRVEFVDSFFKVCFVLCNADEIETLIPAHSVHFKIFNLIQIEFWKDVFSAIHFEFENQIFFSFKYFSYYYFLAVHDCIFFSCSWLIMRPTTGGLQWLGSEWCR